MKIFAFEESVGKGTRGLSKEIYVINVILKIQATHAKFSKITILSVRLYMFSFSILYVICYKNCFKSYF